MEAATQRVDKWLWFSRLIKTRSQASKLVLAGKVRVNKIKISKPSSPVQEGDVITAMIHDRLRIVKVLAPGQRRGPASEAQELYEDLSPPSDKSLVSQANQTANPEDKKIAEHAPAPTRVKGAGRPTKRDRRKITEFQSSSTVKK